VKNNGTLRVGGFTAVAGVHSSKPNLMAPLLRLFRREFVFPAISVRRWLFFSSS